MASNATLVGLVFAAGNPTEYPVRELAELVLDVTASSSELVYVPLPVDDPTRRRPDRSVLDAITIESDGFDHPRVEEVSRWPVVRACAISMRGSVVGRW